MPPARALATLAFCTLDAPPKDAAPALLERMRDRVPKARFVAACAMWNTDPAHADFPAALKRLIKDKDARVQKIALTLSKLLRER